MSHSSRTAAACAAALFTALSGTAWAADNAASAAKSSYAKEHADCMAGRTAEDRATCLKEAGAAQDERKKSRLDNSGSMRQNAIDRCNGLPGKDKTDCLARIEGPGTNQTTKTSGSVAGGGIIRETTTTTTGPAVVVVPATAGSAPR